MSWHDDFHPECENGHRPVTMDDDGPVLHGQSRNFVCPVCDRTIMASNDPQSARPVERVVDQGSPPDDTPDREWDAPRPVRNRE